MAKAWHKAIQSALIAAECTVEVSSIRRVFYDLKAYEMADILNVEMKSMIRGSVACEQLFQIVEARAKAGLASDDERILWYPFATDTILAAYNFMKIFDSPEMKAIVGKRATKSIRRVILKILPRTKEAADAIRHHHDRALGKSDKTVALGKGQQIAQWRTQIRVTDDSLSDFWYSFRPRRIVVMLRCIHLNLVGQNARR